MNYNPIRLFAILIFLGISSSIFAQQDTIEVQLDIDLIQSQLISAPEYITNKNKKPSTQITLPSLDGQKATYYIFESKNMEEPMYSKFPEIRSYILVDISDPSRKGRLSTGPNQVNIMIKNASQYEFISPDKNNKYYKLYKGTFDKSNMICGADDIHEHDHHIQENRSAQSSSSNGATLRTYRIAIATTGEFYQAQGNNNTAVLAKINNYLNQLNDIYEDELAVHFNLIGNNTAILFSDPATDGLDPTNVNTQLNTSQSVINATIGAANYDIGHTFYTIPGGCCSGSGIAQLAAVCDNNNKARGWTGATATSSDALWMGLFAHEIGHQFGADHTMYGTEYNCVQRSPGHGYEPGSGNSLMSYEGICTDPFNIPASQDITPESSTIYFHNHSLEQILTVMNNESCESSTTTGNIEPVTMAPSNKTIPKGTPFELIGSATDGNGDAIYYCWEEYDTNDFVFGLGSISGHPNEADTSLTAPLFRSFDPSLDGATRIFPKLSDIINNTQTLGEILPNVSRNMKFRLTSRDFKSGGGAVSFAEVDLTVDASIGPFDVTSQSTATTWTANGSNTATITWNVAGTNTLCTNVDILFSTDKGVTFPHTIAASTNNDGSHTFTIPSLPTSVGRIKVKCSDNYFFDINEEDIILNSTCDAVTTSFSPDTNITAIEGSSALNLSLAPNFGTPISNFTGTISNSDPVSSVAGTNSTGGCQNFNGNITHYDQYNFQVSSAGTYTFDKVSGPFGIVLVIYEGSFTPGGPCNNFIASSYNTFTGNLSDIVSGSLTPGVQYVLVVSSFSSTLPTLPAAYIVDPLQTVYSDTPPPSSAFSYTYVAVNQSTGLIAAISPTSDFTSLPAGTFIVHGLSYETSSNLNPYIGNSFSSFQTDVLNLVVCGAFSSNTITLTVQSNSACPPNYAGSNALSGAENTTVDYETDGSIQSTQLINAGAIIDYDSGTDILLEAPFEVKLGATFHAFIDGCGGALQNSNTEEK